MSPQVTITIKADEIVALLDEIRGYLARDLETPRGHGHSRGKCMDCRQEGAVASLDIVIARLRNLTSEAERAGGAV